MKLLLSVFLTLALGSVFAANKFIKGEGKFVATDDDSHEFITKQLTHEGFRNIITKELKNLGLNSEVFWQKVDETITPRVEAIDKELRLKYKIDDNPTSNQTRVYKQVLRRKKLTLRRNIGRISNVISRYAVNRITRSKNNGNYRYIRLEGEVDSVALNKLYYRFVRGKKSSEYGSIFLDVNFVLDGVTYSELNIENENEFEDVVLKSWLDWFSKNKPGNIANIDVLEDSQRSKLAEYMKLPSEAMLTNIPEFCVNSLLLKVEVKISKTKFDSTVNRYDFEYAGSAFLKDLQTNLNINTYNLNPEEKSYLITEDVNLANILANHVYKMALSSFPRMVSSIKNLTPISSIQRVSVFNYSNMEKLNTLINKVKESGIKYSLKAEIENISKQQADFVLYFDGDISEVKSLLLSINSAKNDLTFELIDTNNTLSIKFNKPQVTENL